MAEVLHLLRGERDLGEDHPVDPTVQCLDRRDDLVARRRRGGGDDEQVVAALGAHRLGAGDDVGEVPGVDHRHDDRHRVGATGRGSRSRWVRSIVELAGHLLHPVPGASGDVGQAAQGAAHRGHRDAGFQRDVLDGRALGSPAGVRMSATQPQYARGGRIERGRHRPPASLRSICRGQRHYKEIMTLQLSDDGPVRIVTIDRPQRRNAVDAATAAELLEAFTAFDEDEAVSVAVLTGAGGAFCAGADLKALAEGDRRPVAEDGPGPMGPTPAPPHEARHRRHRGSRSCRRARARPVVRPAGRRLGCRARRVLPALRRAARRPGNDPPAAADRAQPSQRPDPDGARRRRCRGGADRASSTASSRRVRR